MARCVKQTVKRRNTENCKKYLGAYPRCRDCFFGRPDLSLVFNVCEDLSGLLSFDNDYNTFTIHSTENVIEALIWFKNKNYFYRNIYDEIACGFLKIFNVNQNIINDNSNLKEINQL